MNNSGTSQKNRSSIFSISHFNSLFWRLLLSLMLLAVLPLLVVVVTEYQRGRDSLHENLHFQLEVINEQITNELDHYLASIKTSMVLKSPSAGQMLMHLEQSQQAQQDKSLFTQSFSYQLIISQYQNEFSAYVETYDLSGFMVADDEGNILHTEGMASSLSGS